MKNIIIAFSIIFCFCYCANNEKEYTPKPRAYYRIDFPKYEYTQLAQNYPYSFEVSKHSEVIDLKKKEPYWVNLHYKKMNAIIHLSYKKIENNFSKISEDSRKLTYKHFSKADGIEEKVVKYPEKNVYGILYQVKGNAASSLQFALTDSINNFIRGSLYFNCHPNIDSIKPVLNYLKKDVDKLIETFEWKK